MKKYATLSEDRKYRYTLTRIWDETKPKVMFIGLNPSTADETKDDPTIIRCINFAKSWGYGGLEMTNLFAFRATNPKVMKNEKEPIGKDNDTWLKKLATECDIIIGAWGNDGALHARGQEVMNMLDDLHYLALNKSGHPSHPLYLKSTLQPQKI